MSNDSSVIPTEFWRGSYCFRVDNSAQTYGRETRRVYRLVGIPGYSFSYDPDRVGGSPDHPWSSVRGSTQTGERCVEVTIKQLEHDVKRARELLTAYDEHHS